VSTNNTTTQQNDPHELLEVFDAAGRPTGQAKSRSAIHLDGDWHQAFHCWIVRPAGEVVLQRRSLVKDTFPGFWDASAAGHWRFGETAEEAAREISEELGLEYDFAALEFRGTETLERTFPNGLIDREHHRVYVLSLPDSLLNYRPDPAEVSALAALPIPSLIELLRGRWRQAEASEAVLVAPDGTLSHTRLELRREELVPYSEVRLRRILGFAKFNC
jgi:isopentenyldiphosphate isomerase